MEWTIAYCIAERATQESPDANKQIAKQRIEHGCGFAKKCNQSRTGHFLRGIWLPHDVLRKSKYFAIPNLFFLSKWQQDCQKTSVSHQVERHLLPHQAWRLLYCAEVARPEVIVHMSGCADCLRRLVIGLGCRTFGSYLMALGINPDSFQVAPEEFESDSAWIHCESTTRLLIREDFFS